MGKDFIRIKEAIKAAGFTYESLGEKVGLTKTSIARIASGDQTPSFDTLLKIANTLDVDIRDLFHPTKDTDKSKDQLIDEAIKKLEEAKDKE